MPRFVRALLASALAAAALAAASSPAAAYTDLIIDSGNTFTATSQGLQSFRTTISGLIPIDISCSSTATWQLTAGTYTGAGPWNVGSQTGIRYTCHPTALGTPTVTESAPGQITSAPGLIQLNLGILTGGTWTTQIVLPSGSCSISIGKGILWGASAVPTVLPVTGTTTVGPCSNLIRGGITKLLDKLPRWGRR